MSTQVRCFFCKADVPRADTRAKSVLCSTCVAKLAGSPTSIGRVPSRPIMIHEGDTTTVATKRRGRKPKQQNTGSVKATTGFGRGRGWHLKKKFVAPDGTVYSFGQKV